MSAGGFLKKMGFLLFVLNIGGAIAHPAPPVPGALLIFEITQRFEEPVSKTTLKG